MSTSYDSWSFNRSNDWITKYPACNKNASRIAPLNIDNRPGRTSACNTLCKLSVKYEPTTCSVSMINNVPTVRFSPNCLIKFKNEFYYLVKMTIHYSSMHTINDNHSDLEILLYHNRNPVSDKDGGIILSILLTKGNDFGPANEFMNEFINQMPANEMSIEKDIDVSSDWNPIQIFPNLKSFYYYDGALPYPPCTQNWTFIVFEEIVPIAINIIDTVQYMIGPGNKNIRPVQKKPSGITIFYNANSDFDYTQDTSNSSLNSSTIPIITNADSSPSLLRGRSSWLKENIYYIKGIVITVILLLMVFIAIKLAKIIVFNDLLNSFIIKQLEKRKARAAQEAKASSDAQQAEEYGGTPPPAEGSSGGEGSEGEGNNNNNKNNNNN
jgi:carbonic anhydrase